MDQGGEEGQKIQVTENDGDGYHFLLYGDRNCIHKGRYKVQDQ